LENVLNAASVEQIPPAVFLQVDALGVVPRAAHQATTPAPHSLGPPSHAHIAQLLLQDLGPRQVNSPANGHFQHLEIYALYTLRFGMRYAGGYRTADIMASVEQRWPAVSAALGARGPLSRGIGNGPGQTGKQTKRKGLTPFSESSRKHRAASRGRRGAF
jgi:hypothetical protein